MLWRGEERRGRGDRDMRKAPGEKIGVFTSSNSDDASSRLIHLVE